MAQRRSYAVARRCGYCKASFNPRQDAVAKGYGTSCSRKCAILRRTKTLAMSPNAVVKMYEGGQTIRAIARELGLNPKRISALLHAQGARMRLGGRPATNGYLTAYAPMGHPLSAGHRAAVHVLVAAAQVRRQLSKSEVVHHLNGDRQDNRPGNLVIVSRTEHARLHAQLEGLARQLMKQGMIEFKDGSYTFSSQLERCLNYA